MVLKPITNLFERYFVNYFHITRGNQNYHNLPQNKLILTFFRNIFVQIFQQNTLMLYLENYTFYYVKHKVCIDL